MDPITLAIVTALAAGVEAGGSKVAEQAIVDSYNALKSLIKSKFGMVSELAKAVDNLESKPDSEGRKAMLEKEVAASHANQDAEILEFAEKLLELVQSQSGVQVSYHSEVKGGGAAAIGNRAKAVGKQGILIGGNVEGDLVVAGGSRMEGGIVLEKGRFLNAGFFTTDGEFIFTDKPLVLGRDYILVVNIGRFWGYGSADKPFPDKMLAEEFKAETELTLDVVAHSFDVEIDPICYPLQLPKKGDSPFVKIPLTLQTANNLQPKFIDIDVFYYGHLLQSRRLEFKVVEHEGVSLLKLAGPVQNSYITFTRTAVLSKSGLAELAESPRHLTVVTDQSDRGGSLGLHFFDNTGDSLHFEKTRLTPNSISTLLDSSRKVMLGMMNKYAGTVGSNEEVLKENLGQLATAGRHFYLGVLPGLTEKEQVLESRRQLQIRLKVGTIIQIAPLFEQPGIPWEILYERPYHGYDPKRTKLCNSFRTHGP